MKSSVHGNVQSKQTASSVRHKNLRGTTTLLSLPFCHVGCRVCREAHSGPHKQNDGHPGIRSSRVGSVGRIWMRGGGEGTATFHTAEGRVSSMKLGLDLQHSVTFWKTGWQHTNGGTLRGPSIESSLVSEKRIVFFAWTVWTQIFEWGWVVAAIYIGKAILKYPIF